MDLLRSVAAAIRDAVTINKEVCRREGDTLQRKNLPNRVTLSCYATPVRRYCFSSSLLTSQKKEVELRGITIVLYYSPVLLTSCSSCPSVEDPKIYFEQIYKSSIKKKSRACT